MQSTIIHVNFITKQREPTPASEPEPEPETPKQMLRRLISEARHAERASACYAFDHGFSCLHLETAADVAWEYVDMEIESLTVKL